MREPITYLHATLPVWFERGLQWVDLVPLLSVGIIDHHDTHLLEQLGRLNSAEGCFSNALALILVESRFGIKTLHVTDSPAHEQPNHIFGFCWMMMSAKSRTRNRHGLLVKE